MTLGCGAIAGNITSDNVGPLHLINVKRLAYVVRKPEEAFEMPMDINQAPNGPTAAAPNGEIDHNAVVAAVERYLASRGIAVAAPAAGGPSCTASCAAPKPAVSNVVASVVDRFLARRGEPSGGYT
jgi:acetaldehyde dehydrogenase (acetylating)